MSTWTGLPCRKASELLAHTCAAAGHPHAALLFLHDSLAPSLRQQYGHVLRRHAAGRGSSSGGMRGGLDVKELGAGGLEALESLDLDYGLGTKDLEVRARP